VDGVAVVDLATKNGTDIHKSVMSFWECNFLSPAVREYLEAQGACEHQRIEELVAEGMAMMDHKHSDRLVLDVCRRTVTELPEVVGDVALEDAGDLEFATAVAQAAVDWLNDRGLLKSISSAIADPAVSAQLRLKRVLLEIHRAKANGVACVIPENGMPRSRSRKSKKSKIDPPSQVQDKALPLHSDASGSGSGSDMNKTRTTASATSSTECGGTDSDSANGRDARAIKSVRLAPLLDSAQHRFEIGQELTGCGPAQASQDGTPHVMEGWSKHLDVSLSAGLYYSSFIEDSAPSHPGDASSTTTAEQPTHRPKAGRRRRPHRAARQAARANGWQPPQWAQGPPQIQ